MTSHAERFYEPVKTGISREFDDEESESDDFDWEDLAIYGVRERGVHGGRVLGSELRLTWRKADLLCDLLETIRSAASGIAAATAVETTEIGSTEGKSPTGEAGDAQ